MISFSECLERLFGAKVEFGFSLVKGALFRV